MQDLVQLIHIIPSLEDRLPREELSKDAPHAPHIDRRAIVRKAQHDLRRAVPPRGDVLRHEALVGRAALLLGGAVGGGVAAREAEVADFELAVGVDEEVAGLEVAVEDVGGVDVFEAAEGLVDEGLEVGVRERLLGANLGGST